jgi:hypothetical protein
MPTAIRGARCDGGGSCRTSKTSSTHAHTFTPSIGFTITTHEVAHLQSEEIRLECIKGVSVTTAIRIRVSLTVYCMSVVLAMFIKHAPHLKTYEIHRTSSHIIARLHSCDDSDQYEPNSTLLLKLHAWAYAITTAASVTQCSFIRDAPNECIYSHASRSHA